MSSYFELANLAADASFLARIGYAIGKYASYIFNEDPGSANHAARLNWAIKATTNVPAMAASLVQNICQDVNVVAGLAAVTDANLQTVTETAANDLIGVPIRYMDLNNLANDSTFLRRVQIAIAHFAGYILNESPSTANHPACYSWAKNAILTTQGLANALAPAMVMDTVVERTSWAPPTRSFRRPSSTLHNNWCFEAASAPVADPFVTACGTLHARPVGPACGQRFLRLEHQFPHYREVLYSPLERLCFVHCAISPSSALRSENAR